MNSVPWDGVTFHLPTFRKYRSEVRKISSSDADEYYKKNIDWGMIETKKISEKDICIIMNSIEVEYVSMADELMGDLYTKYKRYVDLFEKNVAILLMVRGINILPLRSVLQERQYYWALKENWILNSDFQNYLKKDTIDKLAVEKYFDMIDESTVVDRTAAVVLIGLRNRRRNTALNQHPREVILIIAKMVHQKSLGAAWAKVRDVIDSIVTDAKKVADAHHRHLQSIGKNY